MEKSPQEWPSLGPVCGRHQLYQISVGEFTETGVIGPKPQRYVAGVCILATAITISGRFGWLF